MSLAAQSDFLQQQGSKHPLLTVHKSWWQVIWFTLLIWYRCVCTYARIDRVRTHVNAIIHAHRHSNNSKNKGQVQTITEDSWIRTAAMTVAMARLDRRIWCSHTKSFSTKYSLVRHHHSTVSAYTMFLCVYIPSLGMGFLTLTVARTVKVITTSSTQNKHLQPHRIHTTSPLAPCVSRWTSQERLCVTILFWACTDDTRYL